MKRGKGLSRGPIPRKARTPIKHKPRPKDQTERIYGPQEFRDWLHCEECAVCGSIVAIEQAHAKGDGVSRKADWTLTFAACGPHYVLDGGLREVEGCHAEMHRIGVKSFEKKHGVKLLDLAAETQERWQAYSHSRKSA